MIGIVRFFAGTETVLFPGAEGERTVRRLLNEGFPFYRCTKEPNGIRAELSNASLRRLRTRFSKDVDTAFELTGRAGLPALYGRYRRRYGLFAGALFFVILTVLSSLFVWDVRPDDSEISREELCALLDRYGIGVGTFLPTFDPDLAELSVRVGEPSLSRLSINRHGTVLYVEIREEERTETDPFVGKVTKLTASMDGIVHHISMRDGKALVTPGQAIRKGEILAIGVEGGTNQYAPYRYRRADGEIVAEVFHEISFEIPEKRKVPIYTGEILTDYQWNFFKKKINLFTNSSILQTRCDIIEDGIFCTFQDGSVLPIFLTRVTCLPYTETEQSLTEEQLRLAAEEELNRRMAKELPDAEPGSREITFEKTNDGISVHAAFRCYMNVAEESEMTDTEIAERIVRNDGENSTD